jgi:hypothetical protein
MDRQRLGGRSAERDRLARALAPRRSDPYLLDAPDAMTGRSRLAEESLKDARNNASTSAPGFADLDEGESASPRTISPTGRRPRLVPTSAAYPAWLREHTPCRSRELLVNSLLVVLIIPLAGARPRD